jgi:hypothetical protein
VKVCWFIEGAAMPQSKGKPHRKPEHASVETEHVESALDEALDESFPASDPVAISFDPESAEPAKSGPHKTPPG